MGGIPWIFYTEVFEEVFGICEQVFCICNCQDFTEGICYVFKYQAFFLCTFRKTQVRKKLRYLGKLR